MNSFLKGCEAVGTVRLACRWIARAALALSTIILLAPDADAGRLRQATESRVALEIPESFIQSYRFVGFADAASGASFQILDLRGEGYESWKADALRAIPREERFVEPPQIRELPGRMGEYQYTVNEMMVASVSNHLVNYDQPIVRYSFVFREGAFAAKIVAKVPKGSFESGAVTQEQIERVFVSATMGEQKEAFRLGYVGDFARSSLDRKGLPYPKNYYLANQRNTWFIVSVREQGSRGAPLPVIGMDWKFQSGEELLSPA